MRLIGLLETEILYQQIYMFLKTGVALLLEEKITHKHKIVQSTYSIVDKQTDGTAKQRPTKVRNPIF